MALIMLYSGMFYAHAQEITAREATEADYPDAIILGCAYNKWNNWSGGTYNEEDNYYSGTDISSPAFDISKMSHPILVTERDLYSNYSLQISEDGKFWVEPTYSKSSKMVELPKSIKYIRYKGRVIYAFIIDQKNEVPSSQEISPTYTINKGSEEDERFYEDNNDEIDVSFNCEMFTQHTISYITNSTFRYTYIKIGNEWIRPLRLCDYHYLIPKNSEIRLSGSEIGYYISKPKFYNAVYGEIAKFTPSYDFYSYSFNIDPMMWYDYDLDGNLEYSNNSSRLCKISPWNNAIVKSDSFVSSYGSLCNINNDDYIDYIYNRSSGIIYTGSENYGLTSLHRTDASILFNPIDYDNDGLTDFLEQNSSDADAICQNILLIGRENNPRRAKMNIVTLNEYLNLPQAPTKTGIGIPSITQDMFIPSGASTDPESFTSFTTVDVNGDGLPDLLDSNYGKIYFNTGNGQWVKTDFNGKIQLRDLNNDQILDYIVYDSKALTVTSYIIQKDGEPKKQKLISSLKCGSEIWCYDFDKDNDVDILIPFNYSDNKASYLLLMENKGDGTFKKHENYIEDMADFKFCRDIDSDGNYEVIASVKTDSIAPDQNNKYNVYVAKSYKISGTSLNTTGTVLCETGCINKYNSYTYTKDFLIADVDNSGIQNIIFNAYNYYMMPLSEKANQRPKSPAKPEYIYDSDTGILKINWSLGSDAESSPMDLTYALRIGSEPDKGDYLFAHALPDGKRRNMHDGNQGYALQRVIDTSSWPAGKYYISVQSVDPNRLGSTFSEYAIFEKTEPENGFVLSYKKPFAVHDTCTVSLKNPPVSGVTYNWNFDGAEILSQSDDGSTYQITFRTSGDKKITLQSLTPEGTLSIQSEQTITVVPTNMKQASFIYDGKEGYGTQFAFDIDEDGKIEVFGSNKFYNINTDGSFSSIKKLWNQNTKLDVFYSTNPTVDINNDGLCDAFKPDDIYHLINLGGEMEVSEQLTTYDYSVRGAIDIDNDGDYDLFNNWNEIVINEGDYINFIRMELDRELLNNDNPFIDYNKDGLIDYISYTCQVEDDTYYYSYYVNINQGNGTFVKSDKILDFVYYKDSHIYRPEFTTDLDNDGKFDFIYHSNSKDCGISSINVIWGDGTTSTIADLPYEYYFDFSALDFDNNGYMDIFVDFRHSDLSYIISMSANRKAEVFTLTHKEDYKYSIVSSMPDNVRPFHTADGTYLLSGSNVKLTGINERPAAPTGLRARETENAVIVEWNPAVDKETPACHMQYNLSIKRKGATGEGAYLFSPCNSTKNGVPVPTNKPLISSTTFTIPIANIPRGEYEIQVQGVDAWRDASDFSEVYNLVVKNSPTIQMATSTGVGVKTSAKIVSNSTPVIDWGEATVETTSTKTYFLTWNTPGMKTITVDGESHSIYVNPLPAGDYSLPATALLKSSINVVGEELLQGQWEISENGGKSYKRLIDNNKLILDVKDNKNATLVFNRIGEYMIKHTVSDGYNVMEYVHSVTITNEVTTQDISVVAIDESTGKYAIKWNERNVPVEVQSVNIYKETSRINEYRLIANVPLGTECYIDEKSTPEVTSARYRLSYVLNYGESELSVAHQPMHVMINRGVGNNWNLLWSSYEGVAVTTYRILRGTSHDNLSLIAEVSGNMSSYCDVTVPESEMLYYAVEVVVPSTEPMSTKARMSTSQLSSRSNVVSITNAPNIQFVTMIDIKTEGGRIAEISSLDSLSINLTAYIYPSLATMQRVNWIVYRGEDIATIDQNGKLTAYGNKFGNVVVRAYAIDGSGVYGEITVTVLEMSGINDISAPSFDDKLNIYPSPADKEITIAGMGGNKTEVYVFSINGELLRQETTILDNITIDCGDLAPGIYFVKTKSSTSSKTGRFIKK